MTPQEIADAIAAMSVNELNELRRLLGPDGLAGGAGVREPATPPDDDQGWPEPAPLPADYWETAG